MILPLKQRSSYQILITLKYSMTILNVVPYNITLCQKLLRAHLPKEMMVSVGPFFIISVFCCSPHLLLGLLEALRDKVNVLEGGD